MSIIQLNQVKSFLQKQIFKVINQDEIRRRRKKISELDVENIMLSQAFSLFAAKFFSSESFTELQRKVTDDFDDNGIDLIHYDEQQNQLYILQSKWIKEAEE